MPKRRTSREDATPYLRKVPSPAVISTLSAEIPVTDPEIRLIMDFLDERIAEILRDDQGT